MGSASLTRRRWTVVAAALVSAVFSTNALAADSILFRGARVLTVSGAPLDPGDVLVEGGKIKAVGAHLEAEGATVIDATKKTIAPGFIDARSCLYLPNTERRDRGASADWNVLDAIDFTDDRAPRVLAGGVTSAYVTPGSGASIGGRGAVVKVKPTDSDGDRVLKSDAALELAISAGGDVASSSLGRLNGYLSLRRAFSDAKEYRKSWEKYKQDLAEFEKKKKERDEARQKRESSEKKPDDAKDKPKPKEDKPPSVEPPKPADKGSDPTGDAKDEKKDDKKEDKKDDKPAEPKLERPNKPAEDPAKEVLVRALAGTIPVRVLADRADEILNALRLAEEFELRLILDGVGEGGRVAPELSRRNISVVVGPILRGSSPSVSDLWFDPRGPVTLSESSVPVVIASGAATQRGSSALAMQAALLVGQGMDRARALRAITLGAAEALGVAERVGSIEPGKDADLVVLDGDPLDTRSRVESVYVDGQRVFSND
ncbi:MAG: amidohydrolase family protein [Planctomycetes bacterium]|nr:amidohydrolase family protein [Planctomycetota bacterium]MBI3843071.1 amidohydrolase family protein [Planctomycetota bacterium]